MIYLNLLKGEKISSSLLKRRYRLDALYNSEKDRIVILNACKDCVGMLNHELMHKILSKNCLEKASDCWDNKVTENLENWLNWGPHMTLGYMWWVLTSSIKGKK